MDNSSGSQGSGSYMDQNSLGILNMDNLKVFGDLSSFSKSSRRSGVSRDSSGVHERLREERLRALETLEKPRPTRPSQAKSTTLQKRSTTNISELVTDETIDLNSSGSFALATPAPKGTNISFEPAEITGRSTLCQGEKQRRREKPSLSVAEILKSSFVEKARLLEKKLHDASQLETGYHLSRANSSSLTDSFSCSRSLPRTADMSDLSLNGGGGFSFGSTSVAEAGQDESFAPAELMQSKLVQGEISWAQEFAAMPTATLSTQAMQKIAAPPPTSEIETSVSNSVLVGDPDFSLGNYFQKRSENIWNIVSDDSPDRRRPSQAMREPEVNKSLDSVGEKTPQPDNKTYTKADAIADSNLGRNLMRKKQQDRIQTVLKTNNGLSAQEPKRPPSSSEILSLSAIDKALRDIDLNSDTSTVEVVNHLWEHGRGNKYEDENKENQSRGSHAERTLCGSNKLTDTMSFTDSVLNSTDFRHLQQSFSRKPLSPLAEQPQITISRAETDPVETEAEADIDEWPSTPVKEPNRKVRRTKISPRTASPASSDGIRALTCTEDENEDEDKTPVNKKRVSISTVGLIPRNPSSLSSTRLDGCDVAVASSTERDFGISPNMGKNLSPMSSPRSRLSSPLLDSTTSSERRQLMSGVARKANSSPAGSEASSTSGFTTSGRRGPGTSSTSAPRSISRCSNSSEFSHRDGKLLPLKVTHTSLCWGSTKLRTDVRKSMQVKNTADKRLVIRLGIQGPGFQLVGSDSSTITLQAMECRSVVINFCPTVCGAAIGALSFYAPPGAHNSSQPGLEIPLYGYGGSASITIQGLLKGPVGASFLTIGDVCELSSGPLSASLRFHNKGPLTAFVGISVDSTVLMKLRLSEAFDVRPSRMILPPNTEGSVQILFRPNREDLKNILKKTAQVLTLANMRIFCGDEPNRQRMRSLVQRMSTRQREKLTSPMLDSMWGGFPEEQPVRNIGQLNEPPEFILDLVTVVRIIDVALTLNRDFDESSESSLMFLPEAEETVLFRTICIPSSPTPTQSNLLEPVDELLEADTTTLMPVERNWSVQPTSLEFGARGSPLATLSVTNSFRSRQLIEVSCNIPELVRINPSECYVAPDGGQAEIDVRLLRPPRRDLLEKEPLIVVSMENERINVPLSFKF
ncbi:uncharacterized protein LOC108045801 [Drosophila rhopaloa]|uniref:Uncharacterized protein LOC108045801 n=1 Tax=Drosophila rhopaloa TaxID=1041015 RepID=A0A6P4F5T0_DRORH|nr:uncharacterized protein LOC108045801 [Drosophila rhopaloa]